MKLRISGAFGMNTRAKKSIVQKKSISTFTYFIPAPPTRKSGYREKEFDKIMTGILQSGFELVEIQTQAVDAGLFILAVLKTSNKKVAVLDEHLDIQDKFKLSHVHNTPEFLMEDDDA